MSNMKPVIDIIDANKVSFRKKLNFIIPILLLAVFSPLLFLAFGGMIAAIGMVMLYMISISVIPVLNTKLANWRYASLVKEAENNPMPTLYYRLEARTKAIKDVKQSVLESNVALRGFIDAAKRAMDACRDEQEADKWRFRMIDARTKIEHNLANLQNLMDNLEKYKTTVEFAEIQWAAVVAERAANIRGDIFHGTVMDQLMERTSLRSVEMSMDKSFELMRIENLSDRSAQGAMKIDDAISTVIRDSRPAAKAVFDAETPLNGDVYASLKGTK